MSETKFTKGSWSVYDFDDGFAVVDSNGYSHVGIESAAVKPDWDEINGVNHWSESPLAHRDLSIEEQRANACLIAKAPDMYDLLASLENDNNQIPEWLWDKIQLTLTEARGEK